MRCHAPQAQAKRPAAAAVVQSKPAPHPVLAPTGANAGFSFADVPVHAPPPGGAGLPERLRSGVEHLSGLAMDDVRVHRSSPEPAKLGALAFAQGSDIHLGPGQEQHLPHEAWHVVQQKQGRVAATTQKKGVGINDDAGLEAEADRMGAGTTASSATAAPIARPTGATGRRIGAVHPGGPAAQLQKSGKSGKSADFEGVVTKGAPGVKYKHEFPLATGPINITLGMSVETTLQYPKVKKVVEELTKAEVEKNNMKISTEIKIELQEVFAFWKSGKLSELIKPEALSSSISTNVGRFSVSTKLGLKPPSVESTFKPKESFKFTDRRGVESETEAEYTLKATSTDDIDKPDKVPESPSIWAVSWEWLKKSAFVAGATAVGIFFVKFVTLLASAATRMAMPVFVLPGMFDGGPDKREMRG